MLCYFYCHYGTKGENKKINKCNKYVCMATEAEIFATGAPALIQSQSCVLLREATAETLMQHWSHGVIPAPLCLKQQIGQKKCLAR